MSGRRHTIIGHRAAPEELDGFRITGRCSGNPSGEALWHMACWINQLMILLRRRERVNGQAPQWGALLVALVVTTTSPAAQEKAGNSVPETTGQLLGRNGALFMLKVGEEEPRRHRALFSALLDLLAGRS